MAGSRRDDLQDLPGRALRRLQACGGHGPTQEQRHRARRGRGLQATKPKPRRSSQARLKSMDRPKDAWTHDATSGMVQGPPSGGGCSRRAASRATIWSSGSLPWPPLRLSPSASGLVRTRRPGDRVHERGGGGAVDGVHRRDGLRAPRGGLLRTRVVTDIARELVVTGNSRWLTPRSSRSQCRGRSARRIAARTSRRSARSRALGCGS